MLCEDIFKVWNGFIWDGYLYCLYETYFVTEILSLSRWQWKFEWRECFRNAVYKFIAEIVRHGRPSCQAMVVLHLMIWLNRLVYFILTDVIRGGKTTSPQWEVLTVLPFLSDHRFQAIKYLELDLLAVNLSGTVILESTIVKGSNFLVPVTSLANVFLNAAVVIYVFRFRTRSNCNCVILFTQPPKGGGVNDLRASNNESVGSKCVWGNVSLA